MFERDLKKKLLDLSVEAARKRLSPQTGFVHLFYDRPFEPQQDTIPIRENFCYALALCRLRLTEPIMEARALLEKLVAFEVEGNFPVYLHQYPKCKDRTLSIHLLAILHYLLKDFRAVLGEELAAGLDTIAKRILSHAEKTHALKPLKYASYCLWQAYLGHVPACPSLSIEDVTSYLIALQMTAAASSSALGTLSKVWDPSLQVYLGHGLAQEGHEPKAHLLDLLLGIYYGEFPQRALRESSLLIEAALIQPFEESPPAASARDYVMAMDQKQQLFTLFWRGREKNLHSLSLETSKGLWKVRETQDGLYFDIFYDTTVPAEDESLEVLFTLDDSCEHSLLVDQGKASTFLPGQVVSIHSNCIDIEIAFSLEEGEGRFFGHFSKGNRSSQILKLDHRAYDWKIGLRTLQRSPYCVARASLRISSSGAKAGLSTATPMACSPLST